MFFIQDLDFQLEFHNEAQQLGHITEGRLRNEAEQRLRRLAKGHRDLYKAYVALEQPVEKEMANLYQASVSIDSHSAKITATAKQKTPEEALREALNAVECQLYAHHTQPCCNQGPKTGVSAHARELLHYVQDNLHEAQVNLLKKWHANR